MIIWKKLSYNPSGLRLLLLERKSIQLSSLWSIHGSAPSLPLTQIVSLKYYCISAVYTKKLESGLVPCKSNAVSLILATLKKQCGSLWLTGLHFCSRYAWLTWASRHHLSFQPQLWIKIRSDSSHAQLQVSRVSQAPLIVCSNKSQIEDVDIQKRSELFCQTAVKSIHVASRGCQITLFMKL